MWVLGIEVFTLAELPLWAQRNLTQAAFKHCQREHKSNTQELPWPADHCSRSEWMRFIFKTRSLLANEVCVFVELEQKEKASKGISILERIILVSWKQR